MRGQINDGSCDRYGEAYPVKQWSMFRALQMKFPGRYTRNGLAIMKDGKKVAWLNAESIPDTVNK